MLSYDVGIREYFVKLNSNHPGKSSKPIIFHVSYEINEGIYVTQNVNTPPPPFVKFSLGKWNAMSRYSSRAKRTRAINLHDSEWSVHLWSGQTVKFPQWTQSFLGMSRPARQAGFQKARYGERMKNKTQEFSEKRGSGDQHLFKVKVAKLNPSQLYYTFNH